jgi:hypothetical protein
MTIRTIAAQSAVNSRQRLSYNQMTALQRLASNNYSYNIPTATLSLLVRRGLVEQTGDNYHTITEDGIAWLFEREEV